MTRFSNFTNEELDAMESAFCNEKLVLLVDEIHMGSGNEINTPCYREKEKEDNNE